MKYSITASIALALSMGVAISAQEESITTIDVFLFGSSPMLASIVELNPSSTTVALACPSDVAEEECPLDPFTLTMGPSFMNAEASGTYMDRTTTASISCALEGTTSASCMQSMWGEDGEVDVSTFEDTYSSDESPWGPVIVTAGGDKLTSAGAEPTESSGSPAQSTGAAETGATASPSGSQTSVPSPTESSEQGASSTGAASTNNIAKSAGVASLIGAVLAVFAL